MSRQYMNDRWCVRCGRTSPTPYTLKVLAWRRKAGLPIRSVLDLGCGNGRNLRAFQLNGGARTLVGMDMCTEKAQSLCRAHLCRPVKLVKGKLGVDPIPGKQKFDIILLNYSLMFLTRREMLYVAAQAGARLAPRGWCVVEMYPAKDSECKDNWDCHTRMVDFAFATGCVGVANYSWTGIVRQSRNRMVIQQPTGLEYHNCKLLRTAAEWDAECKARAQRRGKS